MSIDTYPSKAAPETSGLHPDTIDEINSIHTTPETGTANTVGAARVLEAAERVAGFLNNRQAAKEARQMDGAHSEALAEYAQRDHSDYVDHLTELSTVETPDDATEDAAQTYANQREYAQGALNREYSKADRAEAITDAKDKVRGFGRSALGFLRKTRQMPATAAMSAAALGLIAGEAIGRKVASGAKATVEGARDTKDTVNRSLDNAVDSMVNTYDKLGEGVLETAALAIIGAEQAIARKKARVEAFAKRSKESLETARGATGKRARRFGHYAVGTASVAKQSAKFFGRGIRDLKNK